jgi:hypothetical protein
MSTKYLDAYLDFEILAQILKKKTEVQMRALTIWWNFCTPDELPDALYQYYCSLETSTTVF